MQLKSYNNTLLNKEIKMAFLGIKVPHEITRLLSSLDIPGEKTDKSEFHITVLYFQDNLPIGKIAKSLEAVYEVIKEFKPFIVTTNTITCFPKRETKPCPIIAKINSKELEKLNEKLKKEFDKYNLEYSKTFKDYKPHISLSYADDEIKQFKIDPVQFSVSEIVLWGGDHGDDKLFITFPLKSPEKHGSLLFKTTIFEKLASKTVI